MPGKIYSPEILIENFLNIDNAKLDYNLFCETIKKILQELKVCKFPLTNSTY